MKRLFFSIFILITFYSFTFSQSVGIKTNLAHWATTTPNIGMEFALSRKYTMEIIGGINPFVFKDNKKIQHWIAQPEFRYWTCESFNGHFFGLHALAGAYNAGGVDVPIGRLKDLKDYRYEGWGAGGGISYGYQWIISPRWNFEFNLGARSEEHTSELQSRPHLVCRLLLEKKKVTTTSRTQTSCRR